MARTVDDVSLLLSVMAGPDRRDPHSLAQPGSDFASLAPLDLAGLKVAWADDVGLRFEQAVLDVCRSAMAVFEDAGAFVSERAPDLAGAMDVFAVNRGIGYRGIGTQVPAALHNQLKETIRWNIEFGNNLTVDDIIRAETERTRLHLGVVDFFDEIDVWAMPTSQVLPFPVEMEYPTEIEGEPLSDYLEWMTSCCIVTSTGCPAISVPGGFSESGLPVGLQLIAAPGDDLKLLRVAAAFEARTEHHLRRPAVTESPR
jgi:amidase